MKNSTIVAALVAAGAVGAAQAGFTEVVGDTTGSASDIGTFSSSFSEIGDGSITAGGDVDWFSFTITADATLQFNTVFSIAGPHSASMQVVTSDGVTVLASLSGSTPLSMSEFDLAAGTYFVGVSGYDDDTAGDDSIILNGFDGAVANDEAFSYKLNIGASIVPLPTAALAGLGLLIPLGVKRRMSRRG
tara:strand:+ start:18500 stop:19066 length:567 start_codon:yes stop_codon:yes gene_type:complete